MTELDLRQWCLGEAIKALPGTHPHQAIEYADALYKWMKRPLAVPAQKPLWRRVFSAAWWRRAPFIPSRPLFRDGDQIYDSVIIRETPDMSAA